MVVWIGEDRKFHKGDKLEWPIQPKECEEFVYIDPIGGASYVFWIFQNNAWVYKGTH